MSSAANNCLTLLSIYSIEANSVDPEQTAPYEQSDLDPHCLPKNVFKYFGRLEKQTKLHFVVTNYCNGR